MKKLHRTNPVGFNSNAIKSKKRVENVRHMEMFAHMLVKNYLLRILILGLTFPLHFAKHWYGKEVLLIDLSLLL